MESDALKTYIHWLYTFVKGGLCTEVTKSM